MIRLGVVLSGGGLRGVAHLGVLRQLLAHGVRIDVLVGVSAGAIIAGFYAGVGISIEDMIGDAPVFKGRHVFLHGLTLRAPRLVRPLLRRFCGVIPSRLQQLEQGSFHALHHGVQKLGIVCHDLVSNRPVYFSTVEHFGIPLSAVVKSSAAVPGLIPTRPALHAREPRPPRRRRAQRLTPVRVCSIRARCNAPHRFRLPPCVRAASFRPAVVYIRPRLTGTAVLRSPAGTLLETVAQGEAAWTSDVIDAIRRWGLLRPAAPASIGPAAVRLLAAGATA